MAVCLPRLVAAAPGGASARFGHFPWFLPGNLVVSRSVYTGTPGLLQPGVTVRFSPTAWQAYQTSVPKV